MNDLITILIILAAIISFLNKIFSQKREQQAGPSQPIPRRQSAPEWLPPWLVPEDVEIAIPGKPEQTVDKPELKKPTPPPPVVEAPKIAPEKTMMAAKPQVKPTMGFNIELASRDDLKRGIVLAEILGPCRARRRRPVA